MTEKRCTDCKHTRGIGYDFWCGEGHTEYEVFGAETNCPYYEYHDWSKGIPMTEKRFKLEDIGFVRDNGKLIGMKDIVTVMNDLQEENEQLENRLKQTFHEINDYTCTIKQLQDKIDVKEALLKQYEEENEQLRKKNQRLIKMLDNVANYMQKEHREIPLDDFVEWWNKMATEGLEND